MVNNVHHIYHTWYVTARDHFFAWHCKVFVCDCYVMTSILPIKIKLGPVPPVGSGPSSSRQSSFWAGTYGSFPMQRLALGLWCSARILYKWPSWESAQIWCLTGAPTNLLDVEIGQQRCGGKGHFISSLNRIMMLMTKKDKKWQNPSEECTICWCPLKLWYSRRIYEQWKWLSLPGAKTVPAESQVLALPHNLQ